MPELPEVETIARTLKPLVVGRKVASVAVGWPRIVRGEAESFIRDLPGRTIIDVRRRAKLLLLDVTPDSCVTFHLKMTGQVMTAEQGAVRDEHTHVVMDFEGGDSLVFRDVRKFGRVGLFTKAELAQWEFYRTLGPEPLEIDAEEFRNIFAGRRGRLKALLLNQQVVAGVGNIYADESLFRAGLSPLVAVDSLQPRQLDALHASLQAVLREAIDANGSSIRDYVDAGGKAGAFQNDFRVYGRKGEPCRRCRTALISEKVAGRTSTYCPSCQPCPS